MNYEWIGLTLGVTSLGLAVYWVRKKLKRQYWLEQMLESVPVAVACLDRNARYRFVNSRYLENYASGSIVGKKASEVLGDERFRRVEPFFLQALSGKVTAAELRIQHPTHSLDTRVIFAPVFDSRGGVEGVIGVAEEITARKEIERQLKRNQESLEFALQSGRMGTWEINLETRALSCSKEMREIWGVTDEEWDGQRSSMQKKVHPDDVEQMKRAIDVAIETGSVYEYEYRVIPQPGKIRWVLSRGRCSYDAESSKPARFSGVVFDITDRKEREQALAHALSVREQFLSIASHELKTPLTELQLLIQLRQRDLKQKYPAAFTPEVLEARLTEQYEYVRRMGRLVDDILDVSRIASGQLEMHREIIDLTELTEGLLKRFRMTAEVSGVEVLFDACDAIVGNWDPLRIEQVLLNLLTNAIRYGNKKPIKVSLLHEGDYAFVKVKDDGVGISKHEHERIFRRFERAVNKNEVSGLGLGLYIAKEIVQAHGGEIRLESTIGSGSEFTVVLPLQI